MCSLCGILGGENHWADTSSNPDSFGGRARQVTWHRERQDRTRLINRIIRRYGLTVSDWSGNAFVVRSPTGKSVIANNTPEGAPSPLGEMYWSWATGYRHFVFNFTVTAGSGDTGDGYLHVGSLDCGAEGTLALEDRDACGFVNTTEPTSRIAHEVSLSRH